MNALKSKLWWIVILALCTACATHHRTKFSMTSDLEEQCRILNKKRNTPLQKLKVRGRISRSTKIISVPARQLSSKIDESGNQQAASLSYTEREAPFSPTVLPASIENTTIEFAKPKTATAKIVIKRYSSEVSPEELIPITSYQIQKSSVAASPKEEHLYLIGVVAVATLLLLGLSKNRTRRISVWAAKNRSKTRALITGIHCVTTATAWLVGHELADNQITIAQASSHAAIVAFTGALILYPMRHSATAYLTRKACDVVLFSCGMALFAYAGNQHTFEQQKSQRYHTLAVSADMSQAEVSQPENKGLDVVQKLLLTLLALGVTIGLLFLLAALSCNIACSGSTGLALLVAIGGTIGIVHMFLFMMKAIFKKSGKEKPEKLEVQKI